MISINAKNGLHNPKNKNDQSTLSPISKTKSTIAFFCSFFEFLLFPFLLHIIATLSPIKTYKIVQTKGNSQLGGLKKGLTKVGYHVSIEDCVIKLDRKPISKQANTAIIPLLKVIFFNLFWI